jgi:hypothetical protein
MATNTNYTTKTAALKATKADMRQVQVSKKLTSKEVWIDDAEGVSTNVLELIGDAQEAATAAAGIHVGTETSMVKGGENGNLNVDADKDGNLDAGVPQKVKGMNFCGNVAVVNNADGTVDFWFMNPDNHSKPTKATESGAPTGTMYVYDGTVNTDGLTKNDDHNRCIVESSNANLTYTLAGTGKKDGSETAIMAADNKVSTIKVYVTDGDGTELATVESPAICEESVTAKASGATTNRGGTITKSDKGVTITLTGVTENKVDTANNINDAQLGYTPGYVRFSGKVQVATSTVLPDGGTCKVKVVFKSGSTETPLVTSGIVYAYQANSLTAADAPTAVYTYSTDTTKRVNISGINYDTTGTITLTVSGIKGTQRGGAHIKAQSARARLTTAASGSNGFSIGVNDVSTKYASGTQNGADAVFSGTLSDTLEQTGAPVKTSISAVGEVKVYEQLGGNSTVAKCTPTVDASVTNAGWLYTGAAPTDNTLSLTDSANVYVTFTRDNSRVLADYDSLKAGTAPGTFDSTKLLSDTDYMKQLLVQGGTLRQTKQDKTSTYTNITGDGKRSYVVPFTANYTGSVIYATVGGMTAFNTDKIRIYLVCKKSNGTVGAQMLNNYNANNTSSVATYGANAIAQDTAPSSNRWKCEIVKGTFALNEAGATYWLVVEMENDCTVQPTSIKISAK